MPEKEFEKSEMKIECPVCKGEAFMVTSSDDVPHFGKFLFFTMRCEKCGFKRSDVMSAELKEPKCYEVEIKRPEDMRTKIVRSSTSTVEVSELGVTIEPGEVADGYITNMEGFLERVEAAVAVMLKDENEKTRKAAEKRLEKVLKAKNGEMEFSVIIKDPFGNSGLIGKGVKSRKLTEKEIKKLKHNVTVL